MVPVVWFERGNKSRRSSTTFRDRSHDAQRYFVRVSRERARFQLTAVCDYVRCSRRNKTDPVRDVHARTFGFEARRGVDGAYADGW